MSRTNHRRPRKKRRRGGRAGEALYQCQKCGHRWYQSPGMVECPVCQDFHVAWLNYDELERAGYFGEE